MLIQSIAYLKLGYKDVCYERENNITVLSWKIKLYYTTQNRKNINLEISK